jgi:CubicO group peptidase (beta-lactamase class C family)
MILDLDLIRAPGDSAVYCSINPHLAGGVLSRVTGRPLPELMYELVAQPLGMEHYYTPLTPLGNAYMGGGWRFRLRDFMKLGQLYLNGGTWHGRRVVSEAWVRRSTEPRYPMGSQARYGYLWWWTEYPYAGRTVQAYFATGNGGQIVVVIPALDLVVAANGGNYNDAAGAQTLRDLIPRYILPAVLDGR